MVAQEILPKKKLCDVVSDIIIKYQNEFNLHKLARIIQIKRNKMLKEKEKLMEKNFHLNGPGSFKQTSLKFFSSNTKNKTKSENVSLNTKNSFKFFSNSQKMKTKSDSKLGTVLLSARRGSTLINKLDTRGSLLADFNKFLADENKKKEEKLKNIENFNKKMKKTEKIPASKVNAFMKDILSSETQLLDELEKKIIHRPPKEGKTFRFFFYKFR